MLSDRDNIVTVMPMPAAAKKYRTTTIRMPNSLYERAQRAAAAKPGVSLNQLLVEAVEDKLHRLTDEEIDTAIAAMADDPDYQRETVAIERQFAGSDWSALKATEKNSEHAPKRQKKSAPAGSRRHF